MGKFKCFDFFCDSCDLLLDGEVLDLNCDDPKAYPCPKCKALLESKFAAPLVLQASYPDGTKRTDIQAEKLANKIRIDSMNLPVEERGKHNAEIKKIKEMDQK